MIPGDSFSFALATEITFGVGARRAVGHAARRFGRRAALVTSSHGFDASPMRDEIEGALRESDVEIVARRRPAGEPTLDEAVQTAREVTAVRADVLIAIGGGSALDLAKAAAVAAVEGNDLRQLAAGQRLASAALPVVALPTTAGSGAEVSQSAILLDEVAGRKRGVRGRSVAPRAALVDPELVARCPPRVTAQAGFDAVAHAVETALSRVSTPITRLLSVEALEHLLSALPLSLERPHDLAARSATSYAAMLMGINLANSTTCLPHRMQYPLGALTRTEHARGVAALMPAWLTRTLEVAPERLALLARATGSTAGSEEEDARAVVGEVLTLMARIGLQPRLRDLGLRRPDLAGLADMVEGSVENDPGPSDRGAILRLYEASF